MCLFCFSALGQASVTDFEEEIINRFQLQQQYYPQEKAYLHFDRNHYIAGDTIWFRGYLVNAMTHRPDTASRYLYVDLVNPLDSVALRVKVIRQDGIYAGYLPLPDDMAEGTYTVWAYTMYMQNIGKDYFFQAPLRISDPLSAKLRMEAEFSRLPGDRRFSVNFRFRDFLRDTTATAEVLRIGLGDRKKNALRPDKEGMYSYSERNLPESGRNVLSVDYDKYKRYIEVPAALPLTKSC
jgi:Large extracellular alpha-helical protein